MPDFPNPFSGNVDRKISKDELIQALRIDIAAELEAIYLYDAHAMATDDLVAKKVLADIRDEEVVHCGELLTLIRYLDPSVDGLMMDGEEEVKEMMRSVGINEKTLADADVSIGSLIKEN